MAYSMNKAIILGNLGQDPEIRYTKDGEAVATLSIATSEKWKDKQTGEQRERTEWHRVVFFGKAAEILRDYAHKGERIQVEGQIRTRKWQDSNGVDRWTTEIHGRDFIPLGRGQDQGDQGGHQQQQRQAPAQQQASYDDFDDGDIPF